jgi:hypothetical protein
MAVEHAWKTAKLGIKRLAKKDHTRRMLDVPDLENHDDQPEELLLRAHLVSDTHDTFPFHSLPGFPHLAELDGQHSHVASCKQLALYPTADTNSHTTSGKFKQKPKSTSQPELEIHLQTPTTIRVAVYIIR